MEEFGKWAVDNMVEPLFKEVLIPIYIFWRDNGLTGKVVSYAFAFHVFSVIYFAIKELIKFRIGKAIGVFFFGMFDPRASIKFASSLWKALKWITTRSFEIVKRIFGRPSNDKHEYSDFFN